ncbi:glycosyltransferase [Tistrella bauzanensis]
MTGRHPTPSDRSARGRIVVTTGGTGGHVFPARALAAELIQRGWTVDFATDARGVAHVRMPEGVTVHALPAGGVSGMGLARRVRGAVDLLRGVARARGCCAGWRRPP